MNSNRKRDVEELLRGQRVPPPPSDLLDKIKNEIPADLKSSSEAPRPSAPHRSYWLPIAASLLIAIGLGVMVIVSRPKMERESSVATTAERAPAAAPSSNNIEAQKVQQPTTIAEAAPQRIETADKSAGKEAKGALNQPLAAVAEAKKPKDDSDRRSPKENETFTMKTAPSEQPQIAMQEPAPEGAASGMQADEASGVSGNVAGAAAPRPSEAAPAAPPVAQASRAGSARKMETGLAERDASTTVVFRRETSSFRIARQYLEEEQLPPASSIRADEFLANFTYGDARPVTSPFATTAELVSLPQVRGETHAILRVAVTGRGARARESDSDALLARNLTCIVSFGDRAASHRLIAAAVDDRAVGRNGEVRAGYSASALYEVTLRSDGGNGVATVAVQWLAPDGSPQHRTLDVSVRDMTSWDRATAGFKLADVAVSFAEMLRGSPLVARSVLQRRSDLLPTWFPRDSSVSDMVTLVRTATRLLDGE